jgi:hypothetical protein
MAPFLKTERGYIALLTSIILSAMLFGITMTANSSGVFARFDALNSEYKRVALGLAESCQNAALLRMSQNYTYAPAGVGDSVDVGNGNHCTIESVTYGAEDPVTHQKNATTITSASYQHAYSSITTAALVHNPAISVANGILFIVTQVVNNNGGSETENKFTISIPGGTPNGFPGEAQGKVVTIPAHTPYSASESNTLGGGYTSAAGAGCSSVTGLDPGEVRTCVLTEDDLPTTGTISVIADVINNNGGTNTVANFPLYIGATQVVSGVPNTLPPGSYNVTGATVAGYHITTLNGYCGSPASPNLAVGNNRTCIITYDDDVPPAPSCADTVMIFDRTGSMSSTDLTSEHTAGSALMALYTNLTPHPQVGVGSFGAYPNNATLPAGAASVPANGQLNSIYTNVLTALGQITGSNSGVGSDLSAAINVGNAELNGPRHDPTKAKVLLLVSDGNPNKPTGSSNASTGFFSPTANAQNTATDWWSNPTNAYGNGGGDAATTTTPGGRHRFFNFNLPAIPATATNIGIEMKADAWASANSVPTNSSNLPPTALGPSTAWNPNTGTDVSAVSTNDSSTSYILPDPQQETFTFANPSPVVPANATNISVTVHAVALGSGSTLQLMEENAGGTQVFDPTTHALTAAYVDYSYPFPTMPNGSPWTPTEVNGWTTRFGVQNVSGNTARVTQMSVVVGYTIPIASNVQKAPSVAMAAPNNQWTSPNNGFVSDNVYVADTTNGHQQGYGNFGFAIPAGASITGIQITTEAKVAGSVAPTNSGTLYPTNDGNYTQWGTGDWSSVDEAGAPSCSSSDYVSTGTSNNRYSFTLNLGSIPDGSTINSITITPSDRADTTNGGTYKTFIRVNGINTDGATLTTTSNAGCTTRPVQTLTPAVTVKGAGTTIEIGVLKVNSGGATNNTVRVGAVNAIINFTPPATGSVAVSLSSNNGGSWTGGKSVTLDTAESVDIPAGNSPADLWGRGWAPTDFNNGNFALRVTNNSTTGTTVSLDQVTVQVFYTTSSPGTTPNLPPTALGPSTAWNPNTGTDVSAVSTNDSSTSYILPDPQQETFTFANPSPVVPANATNISVTVHAVALGSGSTLQLMEENAGGTQVFDPTTHALTAAYVDYSYPFPTMPNGSPWTPTEVNGWTTRFGVQNVSGNTARVTQMSVVVNYNAVGGTACQLGVSLSWDGGTTWTSGATNPTRTQTLTNTETTYTLGGTADTWTRTWAPGDFVNGKFMARVHAIDPGAGCDASAVDHLDWLRAQVDYTIATDPTQMAIAASDAAKLGPDGIAGTADDTEIFTIYYSSDGTGIPDLLAQLASGTHVYPGHQPGSYNDPGGTVNGSIGPIAPIVTTSPSQFATPANAYTSNNQYATDTTNGHQQGYAGFAFPALPPNATVNGVEIDTEAKSTDNSGCQVGAEVSADGGTTWTNAGNKFTITSSNDQTYTLGGLVTTWGRSWTAADFAAGKFAVRLQYIDPGNACTNGSTLSVDQVQAKAYYTVITENSDGDDFFISPNSTDMTDIFHFIGAQVCPAALNPPVIITPTTATINVATNVVNDNLGTSQCSPQVPTGAFTMNVNTPPTLNPSITSFTCVAPPGVAVTVDPGNYSIDEGVVGAYAKTLGIDCSSGTAGAITAGEIRTCVITNDDLPPPPPPPPPPPTNIDPGLWEENP